jgi:hypothetical protein
MEVIAEWRRKMEGECSRYTDLIRPFENVWSLAAVKVTPYGAQSHAPLRNQFTHCDASLAGRHGTCTP